LLFRQFPPLPQLSRQATDEVALPVREFTVVCFFPQASDEVLFARLLLFRLLGLFGVALIKRKAMMRRSVTSAKIFFTLEPKRTWRQEKKD
jgi:hypothetical protein